MKFRSDWFRLDLDKNYSDPAISCQFGWQIIQSEFGWIPRSPIGKLRLQSDSNRNRWGSVKTSRLWLEKRCQSSIIWSSGIIPTSLSKLNCWCNRQFSWQGGRRYLIPSSGFGSGLIVWIGLGSRWHRVALTGGQLGDVGIPLNYVGSCISDRPWGRDHQ